VLFVCLSVSRLILKKERKKEEKTKKLGCGKQPDDELQSRLE
jgi:hypothetical protein